MKHLSFLLLVIWLSGKVRLNADENPFLTSPPSFSNGEVSLPLQDWQSVWKAASLLPTKPLSKPPLSVALQSATYTARMEGEVLHCDAVFKLRSFSEDWQTLPLVGGEWNLEALELPEGMAIVREAAGLSAVWQGKGEYEIKLPLSLSVTGGAARVRLIPAPAQRFILEKVDAARVLKLNGQPPLLVEGKPAIYALPPQGGDVTLLLEDAAPAAPLQPSRWKADAQAWVQTLDGTLSYVAKVYLRAEEGLGTESLIKLPSSALVLEVSGDDLLSWRVQRSLDGMQRNVNLRWTTADRLERIVQVRYELPQSPVAVEWTLHAPEADEAGRCLFALAPLEGVEFSHAALRKVDATQAGHWIKEVAKTSQLLLVEGSATEKLMAKALLRIDTAQATISQVRASTKLVADGSVLHELEYEFTHRGTSTWTVELPAGATLLACKLNEQDERPVQRAPQQLEFSLTGKSGSSTISKICLTYHLKAKAWERVSGEASLTLPKTSLFTQALQWQVDLPDGYEITATEGTVSNTASATPASARCVAFQKQLFTNEAPEVALFYQRIDLAP